VLHGVGSALIAQTLTQHYAEDERHFAFDSFDGLPEPREEDRMEKGGHWWSRGALKSSERNTRSFLARFQVVDIVKGLIPDSLVCAERHQFKLVHIDVDLYEPTWDSLQFFYPRMVSGGVILFDDYGFTSCPGARKATDSFFADKPENVIELATGQAVVTKLA
jgi:hypothetical protein